MTRNGMVPGVIGRKAIHLMDDEDKNRENRENRARHALKRTGHRLRPDGDLYAILPVDSENFPDPCAVELSLAEVESWAKNQGEKCRMGE